MRLISLPENRLVKRAYRLHRNLESEGVNCWGSGIKEIIYDCGLKQEWETDRIRGKPKVIKNKVQENIEQQAKWEWVIECLPKISLVNFIKHHHSANSVIDYDPQLRKMLLSVRCNLPTLVEPVQIDGTKCWRCKLCLELVHDNWNHVIWDCRKGEELRATDNIKEANFEERQSIIFNSEEEAKKIGKMLLKMKKLMKNEGQRQ